MLPIILFYFYFSFECARPFSKMSKPKIFIFEYFSKINPEMNSNPILIPNTPYVKNSLFFFLVVGGSQKSKNIFYDI